MTQDELLDYYKNLLIFQYAGKPKARAHVAALITPILMDLLPIQIRDAFNLETAVGEQLDFLSKYVGVSRHASTPVGPISLTDADLRTVIKLVLIKNASGSSLATIQSLLTRNFGSKIVVSDNATMQLNYTIKDDIGSSDLLTYLTYTKFLPVPMGVQVSITIIPAGDYHFFGARTYSVPAPSTTSPLNNYVFYQTTYPWLSYNGVISV